MSHQKSSTALAGLLLVMSASVLWGTGNVVARSIYDVAKTDPVSIAFFRMALSVPVLILGCLLILKGRSLHFSRHTAPFMVLAGILVGGYQASFYASLPRIGVAIATVAALASAPVLVALFSMIFSRERPTRAVLASMGLAIIGTGLIASSDAGDTNTDFVGGLAFALLAGLLYAANTLVSRALAQRGAHPLQSTALGFLFGAILLFGLALSQPDGLATAYPQTGWLRLLYLGLIPSALGYAMFFTGMRSTHPTTASIATLAEPLSAALIAVSVLGERLSPKSLAGVALLILAMLVLTRSEGTRG
jgi:DME family drug/metabolite transporter